MRPVEKWPAGYAFDKGVVVQDEYHPYQNAKPVLIKNLGRVCSYCENAYSLDRDLHVEHVLPKSKHEDIMYRWDNFLLSCSTCNGRDNKGSKDVALKDVHLPFKNNTFLSLVYKKGGVVIVNPSLSPLSQKHAQNLLDLTGLGKGPAQSKPSDNRWQIRFENWNIAERYISRYKAGKVDINTIVDLVKAKGGWSIWFTLADGLDDVRKALIDEFPGTCRNCFDPQQHFKPIERNSGCPDPI